MASKVNRWASALLALAALAQPGAAQVPDPYATQLAQGLARQERLWAQEGYQRVDGPHAGGLPAGGAQRFSFLFHSGGEYRVVAVCDVDCRNIDLRLYDQMGNPIIADGAVGRAATITSQPRWTGPFVVEVRITHCRAAPCYFALNVYER
jgi:hypothetical protein